MSTPDWPKQLVEMIETVIAEGHGTIVVPRPAMKDLAETALKRMAPELFEQGCITVEYERTRTVEVDPYLRIP